MELNDFLVRAKKATYASGTANEIVLPGGDKKLVCQEENLRYEDTYDGFNPFGGFEGVFQNETLIWFMQYYGKMLIDEMPAKTAYKFLKKALSAVEPTKPFRGPAFFIDEQFKGLEYVCDSYGNMENFHGEERILLLQIPAYSLRFQGGKIKK